MFVTFEGTEGVGKSTLMKALARKLRAQKRKVLVTREPGGPKVSEAIRKIILGQHMDPVTELFLYEAARAEHLAARIRPALKSGQIVLCDRFTDSSLAYQAHARGLPWKQVHALNEIATSGLKPDLTVLLDLDPAIGLGRAKDSNRFEAEGLRFQKRVRQGFLKAARQFPKRFLILRVRGSKPDELAEAVLKELAKREKRSAKSPRKKNRRRTGR